MAPTWEACVPDFVSPFDIDLHVRPKGVLNLMSEMCVSGMGSSRKVKSTKRGMSDAGFGHDVVRVLRKQARRRLIIKPHQLSKLAVVVIVRCTVIVIGMEGVQWGKETQHC